MALYSEKVMDHFLHPRNLGIIEDANAVGEAAQAELARLTEAGALIDRLGMRLHAGHGLTYRNVRPIAAIPKMVELNIGHSIIARALMVGMRDAVAEMKRILETFGNV